MSFRGYMLLVAGLVFSGALFSQAQKDREKKTPVDIKAEVANRYPDLDENAIVLTGEVVFHHNGAVISCDSAIRYSDKRIDCFKNVIINKDSTFVYGDRAEYNGDVNLARVFSPVVKVIDGDATLYTYNFTFNTMDNIGIYYGGGVMYQKDNVMESERGYYYSDLREIVAIRNVEMKNDDYTMTGDSVRYNMDTKIAHFYTKSYIWTSEGDIITADRGRYNTADSTYFFYRDAYVLTEFRETWADTIDYRAKGRDALLYGNVQINDEENSSSAFGDFGQYWGERGETMLTRRPSMFNYSEEHNNNDTIYMRADTIFMFVVYPSDGRVRDTMPQAVDPHAHLKWADTLPDSVRLAIADSLRPVISGLRDEIGRLRRAADSIMNALYPPEIPDIPLAADSTAIEDSASAAFDTIPGVFDEVLPSEAVQPEETPEEVPDTPKRRRGRNRGPMPDPWLFHDTMGLAPATLPNSIPMVLSPDSLAAAAALPPLIVDSLSAMDKVRELLPDSLSRHGASALLELLEGEVPQGMSHLVSDSIDVAALRNVIESVAMPEPEPAPEPEKYIPPEVKAMRERVEALTAEADSLQTAETYIRPKLPPVAEWNPLVDSLALADSLARMDSLVMVDSLAHLDKKALKQIEKAEKRRLKEEKRAENAAKKAQKAALKAGKKAAKELLKAEKAAAKAEKAAQKAEEASRKAAEKLAAKARKANEKAAEKAAREAETARKDAEWRWVVVNRLRHPDSLGVDQRLDSLALIARLDSMAMADSLARLDSLPAVDEPKEQDDTTQRIVRGWYDVKIWRKDMQAVCDSIVGFSRDSTVHMYQDPILWHGDSQIICDSLTLFIDGENIDRAEFYGNPIMGSVLGESQFNQVKGRTMTSWFRDNAVYRHDVFGNAEAFYYIQEDEDPTPVAFIVATSSNMSFLLEDEFVRYIISRENVEWPVYPIEQIPANQPTQLQGFKWMPERQPTLADVFDRRIRSTEREFHESLEQPRFPIAAKINRRREYLIENRLWADRVDPLPGHAVEFVASLPERP